MPTHTPASALVKIFFAVNGAPWIYPTWLDITGLEYSPFHTNQDNNLPSDLTRGQVDAIASYFAQYNSKGTEDEKIKFASRNKANSADKVPGRDFWRAWVTSHYSSHWKIHTRIAKLMSTRNIHPEQLIDDSGDTSPPNNSSYLPVILDDLGLQLFGIEALDRNGRLPSSLREPTLALAQRTWTLGVRGIVVRKARLEKLHQQAHEQLVGQSTPHLPLPSLMPFDTALESGDVSVPAIKKAIRAVAAFEKACSSSKSRSDLEKLKERLEPFIPEEPIKSKGGARRVSKPSKPSHAPIVLALITLFVSSVVKRKKVTKENLAKSATPEEVIQLLETYDDYFGRYSNADDELENVEEPQGVRLGETVEGADPGVHVEAKMSVGQLSTRLGFGDNNMPLMFNTYRHLGGFSGWSKDFELALAQNSDSIEKFSLQWHQLCGVHAALRMILTREPDPRHCTGVLFADDVGLGKTIQAAAIIAVLAGICIQQERNLALPPIFRESPISVLSTCHFLIALYR